MNASSLHPRVHAALALCCFALASGTVGAAEPTGEPRQVTVRYADLDLSRDEGAQTLYRRLRAAAREVCGTDGDARRLDVLAAQRKCIERAVAEAVSAIDRDVLTALHRRKAAGAAAG